MLVSNVEKKEIRRLSSLVWQNIQRGGCNWYSRSHLAPSGQAGLHIVHEE